MDKLPDSEMLIEQGKFQKAFKKKNKDKLFFLTGEFINGEWIYKHDFINNQWLMWLEAKRQAKQEYED